MIAAGEKIVTLEGVAKILFGKEKVDLSPATLKKADDNFRFLLDFSKNKVIYGINTGFGPMAQHKIPYAVNNFILRKIEEETEVIIRLFKSGGA